MPTPLRSTVAPVSPSPPSSARRFSFRTAAAALVDSIQGVGKLEFTHMRLNDSVEMARLVEIYDRSWYREDLLRKQSFSAEEIARAAPLCISDALLRAEYERFPAGQVVVRQRVRLEDGKLVALPVALLSTLVLEVGDLRNIPPTYASLTSNRKFLRHVEHPLRLPQSPGLLFCVSIAVHPDFQRNDIAQQTLDFGIAFAAQQGLLAVPYSAPRGYGAFLKKHPGVSIQKYLEYTKPNTTPDYRAYRSKVVFFNRRSIVPATYGREIEPLSEIAFMREQSKQGPAGAYPDFVSSHGPSFRQTYGRKPTIVDYIRLSGRRHIDPVMDMHIQNGADFLYDANGSITCIFSNSRPEDVQAAGYNIPLTYHHHPLLMGGASKA